MFVFSSGKIFKPFYASILVILCTTPSYAETDAKLMTSGQWRDPSTGLIWMRCSIGQKWTGRVCSGEPLEFYWEGALNFVSALNRDGGFAGHDDWRVPAIEELSSIRKCSIGWRREITGSKTTAEGEVAIKGNIQTIKLPNGQSVPVACESFSESGSKDIDLGIFSNTRYNTWYWSSSPYTYNRRTAWYVHFLGGMIGDVRDNVNGYVRLVRSGQ